MFYKAFTRFNYSVIRVNVVAAGSKCAQECWQDRGLLKTLKIPTAALKPDFLFLIWF